MKKDRIHRATIILVFSCLFSACTPLVSFTSAEVSMAESRWSGTGLEELKKGERLYASKCGSCHYLYKPQKFPEDRWRTELDKMASKSNLDKEEKELILRYLLVKSQSSFRNPDP